MGIRPDLYKRVLHVSSRWAGDIDALAETTPAIRMCLGDDDEFYNVGQAEDSYYRIRSLYEAAGLSEDELDYTVMLDIFSADEYEDPDDEHDETPSLIIFDYEIMGWFFDVLE